MPGDVYLSLIRKMMNMEKQGNSTASQRRYIAAPSSAESDKLRLTSLTSSAETYLSLVDLSPDKFQFKALSKGVGIMGDCKKKPEDCLKKSNILVYQQPTGQKQERKPHDCKGKIKIRMSSTLQFSSISNDFCQQYAVRNPNKSKYAPGRI